MRRTAFFIAALAYVAAAVPADAAVLCGKQRSDGTFNSSVRIREACKARETQLDPVALGLEGEPGPPGADGVDGSNCWDVNGNDQCDVVEEDNNGDSACDVLDCQGAAGVGEVFDGLGNPIGTLIDYQGAVTVREHSTGKFLTLDRSFTSSASFAYPNSCRISRRYFTGANCTGSSFTQSGEICPRENVSHVFRDVGPGGLLNVEYQYYVSDGTTAPIGTVFHSWETIINGATAECESINTVADSPTYFEAHEVVLPFPVNPIVGPLQIVESP